MKILIVSDMIERRLYDGFRKEFVKDIDLIISCGDLRAGYLDFLMTMVNVPMMYVMGNHDNALVKEPPLGAQSLEGKIIKFKGYNFAGLGGCIKYNNQNINMYTEHEMRSRCRKLAFKARLRGGIDVFVAHAPAQGYGDLEDFPHRGFKCFNKLLNKFRPMYMFHGHVHTSYNRNIKTQLDHPCGTTIINGCGYKIVELPDREE